jgi:hypothetical protein
MVLGRFFLSFSCTPFVKTKQRHAHLFKGPNSSAKLQKLWAENRILKRHNKKLVGESAAEDNLRNSALIYED